MKTAAAILLLTFAVQTQSHAQSLRQSLADANKPKTAKDVVKEYTALQDKLFVSSSIRTLRTLLTHLHPKAILQNGKERVQGIVAIEADWEEVLETKRAIQDGGQSHRESRKLVKDKKLSDNAHLFIYETTSTRYRGKRVISRTSRLDAYVLQKEKNRWVVSVEILNWIDPDTKKAPARITPEIELQIIENTRKIIEGYLEAAAP